MCPLVLRSILVTEGQKICQRYFRTYQEPVPTVHVVTELARVMQEYTQRGFVRGPPPQT